MDSLTHIVLGACIGKVVLPRQLKKTALLWGAFAHSVPDLDIISSFFNSPTQDLVLHRGLSHSFFIAVLVAFLLSSIVYSRNKRVFRYWKLFVGFFLLIGLHDLLDTCNSYGTELFAPFSSYRYSFHLLYVVDPLFTLGPLIAAIWLAIGKMNFSKGRKIALWGIGIPLVYILTAMAGKERAGRLFRQDAIVHSDTAIITPTPFNTLLWYGVFKKDSGIYTGYHSVFDPQNKSIPYSYHPQNRYLLEPFLHSETADNLLEFSAGIYTLEKRGDTTLFCIPRFGEINGWQKADAPFTFYYYLNTGMDNKLVMQRGRLKNWDGQQLMDYCKRMFNRP